MSVDVQRKIWRRIASELDLQLETPDAIPIGRNTISPVALLKGYGAREGMLILDDYSSVKASLEEIELQGFGFSVITLDENCDAKELRENVLSDWGET